MRNEPDIQTEIEAIREAIEGMEEAHFSWDAEKFASYLHPANTAWTRDGSLLRDKFDATATKEAFDIERTQKAKAVVSVRHLEIRLYGTNHETAVATFYFDGVFPSMSGGFQSGVWRCSSVWAKEGGGWLLVHTHTSAANVETKSFSNGLRVSTTKEARSQ
jgi:hypothetical protein